MVRAFAQPDARRVYRFSFLNFSGSFLLHVNAIVKSV